MAKYESTWTFTTFDGGHVVTATLKEGYWAQWFFNINVDGMSVMNEKFPRRDIKKGGDYPIRVGTHIGVIKTSKISLMGKVKKYQSLKSGI